MFSIKKNSIDVLKNDAIIFGKIISTFNKPVSIYQIAKKIFGDGDLRKSESFLRWWFEKWEKEGVVKSEVIDGVKNYTIDFSKVKWGDAKVRMRIGKYCEEIELGFTIAIKTKNSWLIVPVSK